MGGRNSKPHKVMRIRYRSSDRKCKSHLVFGSSRKRVKGANVLRMTKVGQDELLRVGEFNPLTQPEALQDLLANEPRWAIISPEEERRLAGVEA